MALRIPGHVHYGSIAPPNTRDSWAAMPRGYIDGLILTRDAVDTDHYINIAAGVCRDSTNTVNMEIADLTKRDDATWAVGDNNGGLNATDFATGGGGPEADTWYHVFVIQQEDGTTDAGFDKDVDATNLLGDSGYTYYRRVGSVMTDATDDFYSFTQHGDRFFWTVVVSNEAGVNKDYRAGLTLTMANVPLGIVTVALLRVIANDITAGNVMLMSPLLETAADPTLTGAPLGQFITSSQGADMEFVVNTAQQLRVDVLTDASVDLDICIRGWIDPRGKDA